MPILLFIQQAFFECCCVSGVVLDYRLTEMINTNLWLQGVYNFIWERKTKIAILVSSVYLGEHLTLSESMIECV